MALAQCSPTELQGQFCNSAVSQFRSSANSQFSNFAVQQFRLIDYFGKNFTKVESSSLFELNEYIRKVFALNFPEPIWINCEISQIKEVRGNFYLDLVEQNEKEEVVAQASGVIWYKSFLFIKSKLGELAASLLQAGTHVKIKVNVDFNERYGYKLVIEDIDPTYTMGRLELARQKIIERLKSEGVWGLNKLVDMPTVVQKIALISSDKAAGYADFKTHLEQNGYGYRYQVDLFVASMQGQNTERDVCNAIDQINEQKGKYDCIVIIRGGGSKLDLSSFDNFNIGYKICMSRLPVITGIGHEIDESIADMTAYEALKTPTACAAMFIDKSIDFEAKILDIFQVIQTFGRLNVEKNMAFLDYAETTLAQRPLEILQRNKNDLASMQEMIQAHVGFKFKYASDFLTQASKIIELMDPQKVLQKGYAIISQEGKTITRSHEYHPEKSTQIRFFDKEIITNNN